MKKWWDSLTEQEKQEYIEKCKKRPEGYVPRSGFKLSEKTRKKMSIKRTGKKRKPFTEEHKKNLSKSKKENSYKYTGENNPMAKEENRKKVGKTKIGRKKVYMPDGSFKYLFPEKMES
jgi:hypothetical protein